MSLVENIRTLEKKYLPSVFSKEIIKDSTLKQYGRAGILATSIALLYLGTIGCARKPATKINKSYEIKDQFITSIRGHPIENFIYVDDNKIASTITNIRCEKDQIVIKYDAKDKNIITLDSISSSKITANFENLKYWTAHLTSDAKFSQSKN